jgi:hypothetical protein
MTCFKLLSAGAACVVVPRISSPVIFLLLDYFLMMFLPVYSHTMVRYKQSGRGEV